ncbi:MAG: HAD family hydrolase [Anaerolineales bacterium]|jgi:FMN phosphatase YigB (HAD superfamily)
MITTVIFDLGGVLVRTEDRLPRQQLAESHGLSFKELEGLVYGSPTARQATIGTISAELHKDAVMESLGLPGDAFKAFGDRFWGGDRLDRVLVDFIRVLRVDYTTALLSNAWDDLRPMLVEFWKIADAFEEIFISGEMGMSKPDPAIYKEVVKHLRVDPGEIVFVDDFIENVEAARDCGWNAIHFRSREQALEELAEYLDNEL